VNKKADDLADKPLFRIDEVATFFDVSVRTIRLWIDHGHLKAEKIVGSVRIPRESIIKCRFRADFEDGLAEEREEPLSVETRTRHDRQRKRKSG